MVIFQTGRSNFSDRTTAISFLESNLLTSDTSIVNYGCYPELRCVRVVCYTLMIIRCFNLLKWPSCTWHILRQSVVLYEIGVPDRPWMTSPCDICRYTSEPKIKSIFFTNQDRLSYWFYMESVVKHDGSCRFRSNFSLLMRCGCVCEECGLLFRFRRYS